MFYMSFSQEDGIFNMRRVKNFFITLWYYISFPYYWLTTRKTDKKLKQIAEEDRNSLLTENDVEFLKSIGIETDLETLKRGGRE